MPQPLTTGAMMQCTMGAAPATLNVIPSGVMCEGKPMAKMTDSAPIVNIPTFGTCMSLGNPMVASATAAALGVLTPMPCIPNTPAPWSPPSPQAKVGKVPAALNTSKCVCSYGGVISVNMPGPMKTSCK